MISFQANEAGKILIQIQEANFVRPNGPTLQNININIREKECWAITGRAGAGKTTLAESLAGQHRLQSGQVTYYFLPHPEKAWEVKKYVALISFQPQKQELNYAHFYYQQRYNSSDTEGIKTVQDFLTELTDPPAWLWKKVVQLLQLTDLLLLEIIKLSNGQTRKMLIARALLRQPRLLILDNPFSGLDKQARQDFKDLLQQLASQGVQIILVTSPNEIPEYITHVLELENFAIKSIHTRPEYIKLIAQTPVEIKTPPSLPEEDNLFAHGLEPDFEVAVKFVNTNIRYDQNLILDNLNWTVRKGEKWALLGPNGSGKTTLLSLINGDNPQAFANKITLFDRPKGSGESIWDIKKRIGFVSPELHLYFRQNLTAATVAATGFLDTLYLNRRLTVQEEALVNNFFSYFELSHLRQKSFLQLSASEQRVVLIIRSLVKNPAMLIWDEPYQGLSESFIQATQSLLNLYATPAKTIIFVSHYEQEIPVWLNKRLHLEKGRIKQVVE